METPLLLDLKELARLIRYWILLSTTEASSGHPSSSLSAVELMVTLFFAGFFRVDLDSPKHPNNDRVIFSKGHASPLLYALYTAAGVLEEKDLSRLRKFGSPLEGHPTPKFPQVEAATGSLGQGLSIGLGMALNAKYLDKLSYRTFVLLGDSEMSEGSNWEAIQLASFYKLNNLIGIIDVNRLGQRGQTMYGHDTSAYQNRVKSFGWNTKCIDGHDFTEIISAFNDALEEREEPTMIIAKTLKGKGISQMQDKDGWHGKTLTKDEFNEAIKQLGSVNRKIRGKMKKPSDKKPRFLKILPGKYSKKLPSYEIGQKVATRKAYGTGLARIGTIFPNIVALDAEMKNSTYSKTFEEHFRKRFFEMYIAEQNMVSAAVGLSLRGKIPFVSTFAAFLTRAYDQIRMAQYSETNIKFIGSHVGVSIGQDGPSQMGLEDIAMFRSIHGSVVLYPSDAVSCERLVEEAAKHHGILYIRTTRKDTPVIYSQSEKFPIGGSKTVKESSEDSLAVLASGVTLHEAIAAYEELRKDGIHIRIIDLYSIKPIDKDALLKASKQTKALIVVEDHHPEGGIVEAVRSALSYTATPIHSLSVRKEELSGTPEELLDYEDIAAVDIVSKVNELLFGGSSDG